MHANKIDPSLINAPPLRRAYDEALNAEKNDGGQWSHDAVFFAYTNLEGGLTYIAFKNSYLTVIARMYEQQPKKPIRAVAKIRLNLFRIPQQIEVSA